MTNRTESAVLSEGSNTTAKPAERPTVRLLVIDDDPANLKLVRFLLSDQDLEIHAASNPQSGMEIIQRLHPQIVLLDLVMPGVKGMGLLQQIVEFDPTIDVILMTGQYSTESAVEAIQKGACDYLPKPFPGEKLQQRVGQLVEDAKRRQRGSKLENDLLENFEFEGMIGRSPLMLDLFSKIRRIAPHFRTVLVTGPTGVGKELVARALHRLSPVHGGPFVALNCSSISETLAESELFGHVKGAFTGAEKDRAGIFEFADGGTAMLDEIGDMPLPMQAKLLRVLQNHEIQRLGSSAVRKVDARVVGATNRYLRKMASRGEFREDLYFRLSMIELKVPALADRLDDLPLLERFFLKHFSSHYQKPLATLTRRAQAALARYPWPGNVRELENVIGHACMMAESDVIDVRDLPEDIQNQSNAPVAENGDLLSIDSLVRAHAQRVLDQVGGNKVHAAEVLGISRTHLYQLLKKGSGESKQSEEKQPDEELD